MGGVTWDDNLVYLEMELAYQKEHVRRCHQNNYWMVDVQPCWNAAIADNSEKPVQSVPSVAVELAASSVASAQVDKSDFDQAR